MRSLYHTAIFLVHAAIASAQLTPVLDSSTEAFIGKVLGRWESATGVAVALVRQDSSGWHIETAGYGPATVDGSKNLFTAVTAGLLTHDSRLSRPLTWSTRLKDVVPGWGLVDEIASHEATVQDLLSHRTGVPRHDAAVRRGDTNADVIRKVRNHKPAALFRDIWQYNNNMYKILATLAPTLLPSRQPHARYVKENIFDKLGLNSTTYSYAAANQTGELADPTARDVTGGKVTFRAIPYWLPESGEDGDIDAGDGGIISTAADLATWIQALLLNGANPKTNQSVIPADVVQRLATGVSVEPPGGATFPELSPVVYGAGQERGSYRGHEFIEHSGAVPGYNTVISRYPNSNFGIAVLSNDNELGGVLVRIIQYYIADRIFGLDQVDWDSRYEALFLTPGGGPGPTPRPANATFPYGDIKKVEGLYDNAGYGKTEFCYIPTGNSTSSSAVKGGSKTCNALRANISTVLPGIITSDAPTFVAPWNATTLSHVVLRHFNGGLFNLSAVQTYPTGNSSSPYWAQDLGVSALAEVGSGLLGIGLSRGVWGSVSGVPEPTGDTPKERAEVWFTRT